METLTSYLITQEKIINFIPFSRVQSDLKRNLIYCRFSLTDSDVSSFVRAEAKKGHADLANIHNKQHELMTRL